MNVLDLFSGIGGFSLGLERAGMRTVAFCEIDPYCRAVLRKHWPNVPIYEDITTLTAARLAADGIITPVSNPDCGGFVEPIDTGIGGARVGQEQFARHSGVDVICGGFPCQDISYAGRGAGITGERSGLWTEYARLIGELRPRYAIVENVPALLSRGLDRVLGDLAEIGFDAEWHCIPASAVGAPHRRDRIWIVAYPQRDDGGSRGAGRPAAGSKGQPKPKRALQDMADANSRRRASEQHAGSGATTHSGRQGDSQPSGADVADPDLPRLEGRLRRILQERAGERSPGKGDTSGTISDYWLSEPNVGRVVDGISSHMDCIAGIPIEPALAPAQGGKEKKTRAAGRVHRLRSLGNAVCPQIPEIIGRAIMEDAA